MLSVYLIKRYSNRRLYDPQANRSINLDDLAEIIRNRRFRLEENYAHMLVRADLACGYGACLACVVPTANGGVTRACVHGPVIDLTRLIE